MIRTVAKVVTGHRTIDGAGVHLTRVLGLETVADFDPFLMLDAFDSRNPDDYTAGFPWHPHRGIETVTYLVHGRIEHGDSLGNHGEIVDGSCQWMTAGGGIIHQEMPKACEHMYGTQLWVNLPRKDKMTPPVYNDIHESDMVKVPEPGIRIVVVSGEYKGEKAKMQGDFVRTTYYDVGLDPSTAWRTETPESDTAFIYILEGTVVIDGTVYDSKRAVLFGKGTEVSLSAGSDGARFFFHCATPLKEPVAWGGPIVMNTKAELQQAFDEIKRGTFAQDCHKASMDYYG